MSEGTKSEVQPVVQSIKLGDVFASQKSWQALLALRMPPKTAYRISKYARRVSKDIEFVEKERTKFIYAASGAKEGEQVKLEPNTPSFQKFIELFSPVLQTDSDLVPLDITLESVIEQVGDVGAIDAESLVHLEPFFKQ